MKRKNINILYTLGVIFLIIYCLFPIIWCFIISITPESEMLVKTTKLLPQSLVFGSYRKLLTISGRESQIIIRGMKNALKISMVTILIGIPITFISGYVITRYDFKFKKIFLNILFLTIIIPVFTTIIPIYNIFRKINLLDSMAATSIIYISSFLPMNTFIVINYLKDIPEEIFEACYVDGFSEKDIFFKVVLPLSRPIIVTISLIFFLSSFKQYIIPTILLSSTGHKVITQVMSEFITKDTINYGLIAAGGILSIIPPAIIASIFRKYLVNGLTSGSVKS